MAATLTFKDWLLHMHRSCFSKRYWQYCAILYVPCILNAHFPNDPFPLLGRKKELLTGMINTLPIQLLLYYIALIKDCLKSSIDCAKIA